MVLKMDQPNGRRVRKLDGPFGPKGRGGDFAADKKDGGWHRGQMRIAGFS